ncbi:hypothetical protein PVAND_009784 [Polypedilum vanderplanki]|uniref:Luciferin 4-monooxygenase n=1 Tax=Polypedilum vanderplanki TaxID=319348 RepID=A0A9J6CDK7_POLVA|nr:hypothetical protein PVAND_009784 [Polypedilum vanderplanki]
MLGRAVKNVLFGGSRLSQKQLVRAILTSKDSFYQQPLANNKEDVIVYSPYPSLNYPNCTIDQYVWADVNKWSHKTALVDGASERSVTYGQLRDQSRTLAIRLQKNFNLKFGDTIAVCLPNSIEFPIIVLAGSEASVTVTTVNPIYTPHEISRQLLDSNATILFGLACMSPILKKSVEMTKKPIKIVYVKETPDAKIPANGIDFCELIDSRGLDLSSLTSYERNPAEDIAMLPYSSGTTGLSKGVALSHRNLVSNGMMINIDTGNGAISTPAVGDHQDVLPCVLPFFHIYGLTCTLLSKLSHGCKIIALPKFTPELYLNALANHPASVLYLVPPIILFLTHFDKVSPKHMESIKYVMSGAAPLGKNDAEQFLKKAPNAQFFQGYGLTEASPVVLMSPIGSKNFGSVGFPSSDTEAKIVRLDDPEFRGVGPNESGELLVRGPQIMLGYLNNEKATKETITDDGWLRTGDIAYYDENREFYITDRLKELIKVKGFQVPPAELEEVLRTHPDILDAAVIGIPDKISGELPRAYIVSKNPNLNESDVQQFVAEKVAEYKRLDGGVEFMQAIPKNATGKIMRKDLKAAYAKKS